MNYKSWIWWLKWISTILTIAGAIFTSRQIIPINILLHMLGSIGWTIVAIAWKEWSLIIINGMLIFIYMAGVITTYFPDFTLSILLQ